MSKQGAAMHFLLVIVLSLHVGYSLRSSDSKHGSHNLLKLEATNSSVQRQVRCTPCEQDARRPVSNHLDPEYRGNGADNLGYDWSAMSWGGPAYPRTSKVYTGGMRGRDGRMMANDGGRSQGNVKVICDTCRSYWDGGRGGSRGRQYDMGGDQNYYAGQPWQRDGMRAPDHFETRVMSPTVGVLVKPGSRIAYIPSRSGEMFWDGVSGGGTRWDGFSNGISWIGNAPAEWDRSDAEPRDDSAALRPGGGSNAFGSWNNQNRQPNWGNNPGRGYYFSNGRPNDVDPHWRDRGYASNWHYGSTNQNGWNGNNMKWNYGGKQWADNDRAANRFYFNSPQDRTYGPTDGHRQYGNQYPNYQPSSSYPAGFTQQPWPGGGNYRPNDKFPSTFQGNFGDKDKPWDYTSRDPFGYRRPDTRPEWARPGPSYQPQGNFAGNYDKHSGSSDGYKYTPSDKNDFEKPWSRPGYGASKPGSSGGFPYGGNHYPDQGSGGGERPNYSGGVGHLFYPYYGNPPGPTTGEPRPPYPSGSRPPADPNYGNQIGNLGGNNARPQHPGDKRPPGTYTVDGRPPSGFPSEGNLPSGYPGTGTPSGGYPGRGSSSGGYTGSGRPSGGFPNRGNSGDNTVTEGVYGGYPSGSGSGTYPSGNRPHFPGTSTAGGYYYSGHRPFGGPFPSGGGTLGYPSDGRFPSGHKPDKFYGEDSSGVYPSGGGSSYPRPGTYPGGGSSYPSGGSSYPSGGSSYPSGGSSYPSGGSSYSSGGSSYPSGPTFPPYESYPDSYFFGGGRPMGYPTGGGNSLPGGNPPGYPTGGNGGGNSRPGGIRGSYSRPVSGSSGGAYPTGAKNPPKGYYTGFITELGPDDGQVQYGGKNPNYFGSSYPGDKNAYPGKDRDRFSNGGSYPSGYSSGEKNRYPAFSEDRYSSGGGGGGGYPSGDNDRGGDKYYYGQSAGKGKYPAGYPSNHRFPGSGVDDFDRNQNSNNDKNSWNYGQNEHKEGIYRRSGGSYPPYRGGQYYTSSYLASMSTTAGSTQAGSEQKTQSVTKIEEVTQPTSDS